MVSNEIRTRMMLLGIRGHNPFGIQLPATDTVRLVGIEPTASSMSRKYSPAELQAHFWHGMNESNALIWGWNPFCSLAYVVLFYIKIKKALLPGRVSKSQP